MSRITSIALIGIISSCSILEDSDITSTVQLKSLKLKSIEVTETLNGNSVIKTATVKDETVDEIVESVNIRRRVTIIWPTFTNPKFQFTSGATTNITLISEYLANGKIKFWRVKSDGVENEKYTFLYNPNGKLASLKTYFSDVLKYDDAYSDNELNFPTTRNSNVDPSVLNRPKANFGGQALSINPCGFSFVWQYEVDCSTLPCSYKNQKEYNYCDKDNFYIVNPGGSSAGRTRFQSIDSDILEEVYLAEDQNTGSCCSDKYYFHPYLLMPGDLRIKIQYAPDWWKEDNNRGSDTNQSVRLKFNYEQ